MISPTDDPFSAASLPPLAIDVYTAAYRVSGTTRTRFQRVADVLNQLPGAHLVVDQATVSEYADPGGTLSAQQVLVSVAEILFIMAGGVEPAARPEMRIPKRAVRAQLALPPFRLTGAIHVPQGSRPVDGLLNVSDRFLTMTDVTIGCGAYSELARSAPAVALQRASAHLIVITDDERPDDLLADVLDESTAGDWLQRNLQRTP